MSSQIGEECVQFPLASPAPKVLGEGAITKDQSNLVESPRLIEYKLNGEMNEHDLPPRPISRLGFNCSSMPDARPQSPPALGARSLSSQSGTAEWTNISQFREIAIPEHTCSLAPTMESNLSHLSPNTPISILANSHHSGTTPASPSDEEDVDIDVDELDSDCSSCGDSDEDSEPFLQPRNPPCRASISRLCFPFVTTSPRRSVIPPPPPPPPPITVPRKFCCLPSPLSPNRPARPPPRYTAHPRHKYMQHGYSRQALLHLKWFWSMREVEWEERIAQKRESNIYGRITPLQDTNILVSSQSRGLKSGAYAYHSFPPATIYPRRGDIMALRDPFCMDMDRFFAGLSTWTIGKTLWMFDVHMGMEGRTRSLMTPSESEDDASEAESETESLDTSGSFSDDSDVTLVGSDDSDSEGFENLNKETLRSESLGLYITDNEASGSDANSVLSPKPFWQHKGYSSRSISKKCASFTRPPWPTNWYHRWQLLADLSHRGLEQVPLERVTCAGSDFSDKTFSPSSGEIQGDEKWTETIEVIRTQDDSTLVHHNDRPARQRQITV